jgi:hypothetical protein
MTAARLRRFDDPTLRPYATSHLATLAGAKRTAADHEARGIRSLDDWLAEHEVAVELGALGASCLGVSLVVEGELGIAVSTKIRRRPWRNAICWHELGHLLTVTARSVRCRPDDWLDSRLERLAWCAAAIYAVSAFEAVQIGWRVATVEQVAEERDIPTELVDLRVALAIRDREIPMLRLHGTPLVEAALRGIAARCRVLVGQDGSE